MSDPSEGDGDSIQVQVSRSLGSLWQTHRGGRPDVINTEISGDVVRCEMEAAQDEDIASVSYRNGAISAVTKITGRRVTGFIPKHDSKRHLSTEVYILAQPSIRR
jgi:hypothetical protein